MFIGMRRHRRNGETDGRKHPKRQSNWHFWLRSDARWFVGDFGRSDVNQHERLGRLSLSNCRESHQSREFGDSDDIAAGGADAAFVRRVRQLFATAASDFLRLDIDSINLLRMFMLNCCGATVQMLDLLRGGHAGFPMVRTAKQHGPRRQSLQGDSGYDKPSEEQAKTRHALRILLRLVELVVGRHVMHIYRLSFWSGATNAFPPNRFPRARSAIRPAIRDFSARCAVPPRPLAWSCSAWGLGPADTCSDSRG